MKCLILIAIVGYNLGALARVINHGNLTDFTHIAPPTGKEKELLEWQDYLNSVSSVEEARQAGMKYKYISQRGIYNQKPSEPAITMKATARVSEAGHQKAAEKIQQIMRNVSPQVMAAAARVPIGIFAYDDPGWVTVFDEYAFARDRPECRGRCDGSCSSTCTFDGRKWVTVAGIGGASLAGALEDTVTCTSRNPYGNVFDIVCHEYAHALKLGAMQYVDSTFVGNVRAAYNRARQAQTWALNQYSMSTEEEYWAEGTTTYMNVNKMYDAGGMVMCNGRYCPDETSARDNLLRRDPALLQLLAQVYSQGDYRRLNNLKICG